MPQKFDTLEQTVAQACECRICQAGGICERVRQVTKSIRRIKLKEMPERDVCGYCGLCGQVLPETRRRRAAINRIPYAPLHSEDQHQ